MANNELFANPFSLTGNDKRRLDSFFDDDDEWEDGGAYEKVSAHDDDGDRHGAHDNTNDGDVERGGAGGNASGHPHEGHYQDGKDHVGHERGRRRRDKTLGDVVPNMFGTDGSSSFNVIWLGVLIGLIFCLVTYSGLSNRKSHAVKGQLQQQNPVSAEGAAPVVHDNDIGGLVEDGSGEAAGPGPTSDEDYDEEYDVDTSKNMRLFTKASKELPLFTPASQPMSFDPFRLQKPPVKIKDRNDWPGAPFVVSPPRLPVVTAGGNGDDNADGDDESDDVMGGNGRLGYLQYPDVVNGTLVFSTEGDLYLTRLPGGERGDGATAPMAAMKLTTTVGNALHPRLNPKRPHLLAYSATYSGTREVYLMDLRPHSPPALRLTYTPGGVRSVVGWGEDGTSIIYSAVSGDVRSLPDVRLYRLRLSWDDEGAESDGGGGKRDGDDGDAPGSKAPQKTVKDKNDTKNAKGSDKSLEGESAEGGNEKKDVTHHTTTEHQESKSDDDDDDKDSKGKKGVNEYTTIEPQNSEEWDEDDDDDDDGSDYTVAEAQDYVNKIAPEDKPAKAMSQNQDNGNGSGSAPPEHAKKSTGDEDKDARRRKLEREDRQRRHLAKLSALPAGQRRRPSGKGSPVRSVVEPVPLAQATEGAYAAGCVYFTRFKQSSSTKRYVGGTAESLWAYCPDQFDDLAVPLTADYNGTSKSPSVYTHGETRDMLFFMSDRSPAAVQDGRDEAEWVASSMDLWAAPLPISSAGTLGAPTRLTDSACQYNGIDLSEYAIDPSTGGVILRIGADLHFMTPEHVKDKLHPSAKESKSQHSIRRLPIAVYSDFSNMQERLIPVQIPHHVTTLDAYSTSYGTVSTLLTARGQTFVAPVIPDTKSIPQGVYGGGGRNMPARRYKVAPGTGGGGLVRILSAKHVPQPTVTSATMDSGERLALLLATDPLSPTGEHAFYLIRADAMASPAFGFAALYEYGDIVAETGLPAPFLGGHLQTGGSTKDGGLGSVYADSIKVSPCGRRFAFTDTDGRIVLVTIPITPIKPESGRNLQEVNMLVLPQENELGQPLVSDAETDLVWSPGGRYIAIVHPAKNQFQVISIADLGSPENGSIELGRIVQATPDRFNSFSPVWGHASKDFTVELWASALDPTKASSSTGATALIFLSDRDVKLEGKTSPWGSRAPSPQFEGHSCVHILPLQSTKDALRQNAMNEFFQAPYGGGGAMEVAMHDPELNALLKEAQKQAAATKDVGDSPQTDGNATDHPSGEGNSTTEAPEAKNCVIDNEISFGEEKDEDFSFGRSSYRVDHIPAGNYVEIVCQLADDPSLMLLTQGPQGFTLSLFAIVDWPSDGTEEVKKEVEQAIQHVETSTDGQYVLTIQNEKLKVISRKAKDALAFFVDTKLEQNIADTANIALSVWPNLEYSQMYRDAWRMLRDYFYDVEMHSVPWETVFDRYLPLVERCSKREELDDVFRQMIGELSALHTFVYGGEYSSPNHGDAVLEKINDVASLGASLQHSLENKGYLVVDVPQRDPDMHMIDGSPMYSPLSDQVLRLSGQAGLLPGDIIVAVNGENVMDVPDIHMLLRNTAGESIRLDVLRMKSTSKFHELQKIKNRLMQKSATDEIEEGISPEPLLVVPVTSHQSDDLAYAAWEWKTRERAKSLAEAAGFSCGYIHIQSMSGAPAMDSFVRGFYPDYNKDALIIDVRNNRGGNIDSWILDVLQRKAWMYWESRSSNITTGGLGWDMQFAFRGHLVVLLNEHTSSDGEGFARGVHELGLGKLVGTRTWGGGIWLSSDNRLVDGGIASAPEIGTYNDNFGWGLGIEQMGVQPDVEVDNNPKSAYDGEDAQLEQAIVFLKEWLEQEPVALPKDPGPKKNMSKKSIEGCTS